MAGERPTNAREQMPESAAFMDDIRAAFGDPQRLEFHEGPYTVIWPAGSVASAGRWVVASPASEHTRGRVR